MILLHSPRSRNSPMVTLICYTFLLTWYFGGFPQQWCLDVAIFPGHQHKRPAVCVWHLEHCDSVPTGRGGVEECVVCKHFHCCVAHGLVADCILHLDPEGECWLWSNRIMIRDLFIYSFLTIKLLYNIHAVDMVLFFTSYQHLSYKF